MKKMPTTLALMVVSWLLAVFGLAAAGYLIIFSDNKIGALGSGLFILLTCIFLAAMIRMFGNMGQMLFDLKGFLADAKEA